MAEFKIDVRVADMPEMQAVISMLGRSLLALRDCQLKLSLALPADDPLLDRVDAILEASEELNILVTEGAAPIDRVRAALAAMGAVVIERQGELVIIPGIVS